MILSTSERDDIEGTNKPNNLKFNAHYATAYRILHNRLLRRIDCHFPT